MVFWRRGDCAAEVIGVIQIDLYPTGKTQFTRADKDQQIKLYRQPC